MKIFLDTANIDQIKEGMRLGLLDGVTTNPTLMAREKKPFTEIIKEICSVCPGPVNAECVGEKANEIITEARRLTSIAKNVVVKIPLTKDGLIATKSLSKEGIGVNITLCFSPAQALLAAKAGANFVSPFIGRLDDAGHIGMDVVRDIKTIYENYNFTTEIIVASIRHPTHVLESALAGADIATIPYEVFEKLFYHPLTDAGIKKFLLDYNKIPKSSL
jgi:transaldolase